MFEESATALAEDTTVVNEADIAEAKKQKQIAVQISRAMAGLASIGKYYKRHGSLPTFHVIASPRAPKQLHKTVYETNIICPDCGLMFIGPISARCQCKVQVKRKAEVA